MYIKENYIQNKWNVQECIDFINDERKEFILSIIGFIKF